MSKLSRLMAMTALAAAASQSGMTDLPVINHRPLPKYKGESPKCKSCKYYRTKWECDSPMKMACENYVRKNKRK